jgi:hypothetical protein
VAIVGLDRAVRAPVEVSREYIETVLGPAFAAYTDVPSGEIIIPRGLVPVGIVEVVRAVKAPVEVSREYIEIVLEPELVT